MGVRSDEGQAATAVQKVPIGIVDRSLSYFFFG